MLSRGGVPRRWGGKWEAGPPSAPAARSAPMLRAFHAPRHRPLAAATARATAGEAQGAPLCGAIRVEGAGLKVLEYSVLALFFLWVPRRLYPSP